MSLTISELEAERAKILEEIESKAQKFSGDSKKTEQPSLKSWLNAAEEIMPASKSEKNMRTKTNTQSNYQSQVFKPPRNKAPFFGGIIVLTLLLTLLGVMYIAYSSIHKELQRVLVAHEKSVAQVQAIQADMTSLQKSIATGGKVELFISLEDKIFALEAQVLALKTQVEALKTSPGTSEKSAQNSLDPVSKLEPDQVNVPPEDKLVTKSVLDKSLKLYTEELEARIDQKLDVILSYLAQNKQEKEGADSDVPKIDSPVTPHVSEVKKPVIQQPLIQLTKTVESPKKPVEVKAPLKTDNADVNWLINEPAQHYTLQLASMPEADSLKEIIHKKQLRDVRILPQTRKGITNHVLITGSFSDRKLANELAKKIKSESGISPWVRKIKDLSSHIQ